MRLHLQTREHSDNEKDRYGRNRSDLLVPDNEKDLSERFIK